MGINFVIKKTIIVFKRKSGTDLRADYGSF